MSISLLRSEPAENYVGGYMRELLTEGYRLICYGVSPAESLARHSLQVLPLGLAVAFPRK